MTCTEPIAFATLVDLWTGELADPERVEEHLFACDECAAVSAQLDRLAGSLMSVVPMVLTRQLREQLEQRGMKIHEVAFEPGRGHLVFAAELDLMALSLRAELAHAARVDLEIADAAGNVHFAFAHVPFDAARGEVLIACQQHFRDSPVGDTPEFRIYAVEAGQRRRVASYVIEHVWPPL